MCMHVCFKLKITMEPNQEFSRVVMLGINHTFPRDGFNNQSLWWHIGPRLASESSLRSYGYQLFLTFGGLRPIRGSDESFVKNAHLNMGPQPCLQFCQHLPPSPNMVGWADPRAIIPEGVCPCVCPLAEDKGLCWGNPVKSLVTRAHCWFKIHGHIWRRGSHWCWPVVLWSSGHFAQRHSVVWLHSSAGSHDLAAFTSPWTEQGRSQREWNSPE